MNNLEKKFGYNDVVLVRCLCCGSLYEFYPMRITYHGQCKCGNENWGSPDDWYNNQFGDFAHIKTSEGVLWCFAQ